MMGPSGRLVTNLPAVVDVVAAAVAETVVVAASSTGSLAAFVDTTAGA